MHILLLVVCIDAWIKKDEFWNMDSKNSQDSHWRIGCNRITQLNETYL